MRAANDFVAELKREGLLERVTRVQAELYGSIALTGKGHGTDRAIVLGLSGDAPDKVDPESIEPKLTAVHNSQSLHLGAIRAIRFDESQDLVFRKDQTLPGHSNGMRFRAADGGNEIANRVYYSVGGGFILREGQTREAGTLNPALPIFQRGRIAAHRPGAREGDLADRPRKREGLAKRGRNSRVYPAHLGSDATVRAARSQDRKDLAGWARCTEACSAACQETCRWWQLRSARTHGLGERVCHGCE